MNKKSIFKVSEVVLLDDEKVTIDEIRICNGVSNAIYYIDSDGDMNKGRECNFEKIKKKGRVEVRIDKTNYYLDIAEAVIKRGTCLRRNYGAIIVKNDEIISTGYTGAVRGKKNCCDIGVCKRQQLNIPSGERYELCRSVHAEQNAIISASRKDMIGSTLYLVGLNAGTCDYVTNTEPCLLCKKFIINAGIEKVIVRVTSNEFLELIEEEEVL